MGVYVRVCVDGHWANEVLKAYGYDYLTGGSG